MKVKHGAFIESEITKVEFPGQGFSFGWIPITASRPGATTSNIVSKAFADGLINKAVKCLLHSHEFCKYHLN